MARLVAGLYKSIGVLSQGQLVEVDRAGLVAGYVGQTALKTQTVLQSALGGVLFLDEAYALAPGDSPNDFGREAIEVLLKGMEDHRKDLVDRRRVPWPHGAVPPQQSRVGKPVQQIPVLPGLHRRAAAGDLPQSVPKEWLYPLPEADTKAAAAPSVPYDHRGESFGNAREVRNFFEDAIARQADRVAGLSAPSWEDLMALLPEDLT